MKRQLQPGLAVLQPFVIGIWLCALLLAGHPALVAAARDNDREKRYQLRYEAELDPVSGYAHVSLTLNQPGQLVRSVEFFMPGQRYLNVRATSSEMETISDRVVWKPSEMGGALHFDFVIDHQRDNGSADARVTETWALLKLDHLFPRTTARVVKGSTAEATMKLRAPRGWGIETPYGWGVGKVFDVSDPHRLFDRPLGWMMAGELAVRRDKSGERHISVASPFGSELHANDMLAFMRWSLPSLIDVLPDFPPRLLIVSGSKDMWRGGLSGVGSLYLHSDRPLISGNRTSPMLHELFHVGSGLHGKDGADWIVEGLAEYYSLTILLRSGGISEYRYNGAFDELTQWSTETRCVATDRSQGEQTAHAALRMRALDNEIRTATGGKSSLDSLVRLLVDARQSVTNTAFRSAAERVIGGPATALAGCP